MNIDYNDAANKIFKSIVWGRQTERTKAQAVLCDSTKAKTIDYHCLCTMILDELKVQKSDLTRAWLLSTLGRISEYEPDGKKRVMSYLNPGNEPTEFVRFWALEGLVAANATDIEEIARNIVKREEENQVRMLALAILASKDDSEAREEIEKNVKNWSTVRALRIVPVISAVTVEGICEIIDGVEWSDISEAILALSQIPNKSHHAERAARALVSFIETKRSSAYWDGMRTQALIALGNLSVESTAPLLIDELSDDNPAIVREAAQALEKVVGIKVATARIVEAAIKAGSDNIERFASALRWMDRDSIPEELETIMTSGPPDQQEAAQVLLREIGGAAAFQKLRARTKVMEKYVEVMENSEKKVRELFETSIQEARSGFKLVTFMNEVVFFLGVSLIVISVVLAVSNGGTLDNWAGLGLTSGGGVLGIIYSTFFSKPCRQVQKATDHLMHLKVIFLAYLRQLHQIDQAYARRLLDDKQLTPKEVAEFSENVERTLNITVEKLSQPKSIVSGPESKENKLEHGGKDFHAPAVVHSR
ncbi:HEAT repeats [uncultured archaeon]|nr:HEAT repeats [uncultured archaeon]